jgi:hypothetical protein
MGRYHQPRRNCLPSMCTANPTSWYLFRPKTVRTFMNKKKIPKEKGPANFYDVQYPVVGSGFESRQIHWENSLLSNRYEEKRVTRIYRIILVISVADVDSGIRIFPSRIPDQGSKRHRILDRDLQQGIQVF